MAGIFFSPTSWNSVLNESPSASPLSDITNVSQNEDVPKKKCRLDSNTPSFRPYFSGNPDDIVRLSQKWEAAKSRLSFVNKKPTSSVLLEFLLDHFFDSPTVSNDSIIAKSDPKEDRLFIVTQSMLLSLMHSVGEHGQKCEKLNFSLAKTSHVNTCMAMELEFHCDRDHVVKMFTSPRLGDNHLVNYKIAFAAHVAGISKSAFDVFCTQAFQLIITNRLNEKFVDTFSTVVNQVANNDMEHRLQEELEKSPTEGLTVATDGRFGQRKNSKNSNVSATGLQTGYIIAHAYVNKKDDPCSQRHESVGTLQIFNNLINEKKLKIDYHVHDHSAAVRNIVKQSFPKVKNQFDQWHGLRQFRAVVTKVTKGPQRAHGVQWHKRLSDKRESVIKHAYYSLNHCKKDPDNLRKLLLVCVSHYSNDHSQCMPTSRCKTDPNYKSSKMSLENYPIAQRLLRSAIMRTNIYKEAEQYCMNFSTSLNESFHNIMNIYLPKRICLSDRLYKLGSHLSILHWNELRELNKNSAFDGFKSSHVSSYIPIHPPMDHKEFRRDRNCHELRFYSVLWESLIKFMK